VAAREPARSSANARPIISSGGATARPAASVRLLPTTGWHARDAALLPSGETSSSHDLGYKPLRMSEIEFEYRLVGTGWSEARFAVGDQWVGLTASYLEDALGDLLLAVRLLVEGDTSARASWAEEPGEYRWLLDRSNGLVRVRIVALADIYDDAPNEAGELIFDESCDFRAFVAATASGARRVLEQHGETGYREKWVDHPFPTEHLLALEAAVA
jgi:hypothetical protein